MSALSHIATVGGAPALKAAPAQRKCALKTSAPEAQGSQRAAVRVAADGQASGAGFSSKKKATSQQRTSREDATSSGRGMYGADVTTAATSRTIPEAFLTTERSIQEATKQQDQRIVLEMAEPESEELSCHILDRPSKRHVTLFYHPEQEDLALKIAEDCDNVELRSIKWRKFADGFPDLFVPNARTVRNRDVAFLASFSHPAAIFEQLSIIYALPRMFVRSFTLVLPFFPTGTMERMEDEGDIATAVTLARILSNIPISRGGPTSVVIFDIHALQERFYFGDNVLPCFESAIPLLKHRLHQLPDSDNIAIAYPDEGAWKRFHKQLQHYPTVICTKVREGDKRIVQLKEGEPYNKHVVIVDDLVQSGSTLIECQKLLASRGAHRVSAFATHGVFPNDSWERFEYDNGHAANGGFCYFWITDSCAKTASVVRKHRPFEILSLAAPIQAALQV